jgi:regulator of RNase E activity RraA
MVDDEALFSRLRDNLFAAVVGDVLDKMGQRQQFLPQAIGPLARNMKLVGRAMPVLEADMSAEGGKPFGLMLEALDDLRPDEVYVATGGSFCYALWGELMSTRAQYLRAAGVVLNGFVRDAAGIEALGFPTFCRGVYAQDQGPRGKVIDFRMPIEIEGVRIAPGDLIFGDREGVLVFAVRPGGRSGCGGSRQGINGKQGRGRNSRRHERAKGVRTIRRSVTVPLARAGATEVANSAGVQR